MSLETAPAPFVTHTIPELPWWRRILQLHPPEHAAIALENLLVEGKGGSGDISRVLRPYGLGGGTVRTLLRALYTKALVHCLTDDTLSDAEQAFLLNLRHRLDLTDTEVSQIYAETIHPRYERALQEVLADHQVTAAERESLRQLETRLRLPKAVRDRIYASMANAVMQKSYAAALSDRRLSPEEEADLKAMADNLGIDGGVGNGARAVMDRFRLLWRIENGDIPVLSLQNRFPDGEVCYFHTEAEWHELRRVTRRISSGASGPGTATVRGARFRMERLALRAERTDALVHVDTGRLYLTNRRLLLEGTTGIRTIRLERILSYQVFADAIVIVNHTGRRPYLFLEGDIEMAAVILGAVLARLEATGKIDTKAQPVDTQTTGVGNGHVTPTIVIEGRPNGAEKTP